MVWANRDPADGDGAESAPRAEPPRPASPRLPVRPAPPAPPAPRVPRQAMRVRVTAGGRPAAGVFVRVIEHDAKAASERACAAGRTTDASGAVTLDVEDPAPPDALLEVAKADAEGLRHGFTPLARVVAGASAAPNGTATVALPEGGSLRVKISGLDPADRPRTVVVTMFAPFGEWLSLFGDLPAVPASDGGLTECGVVPRAFTFSVGPDGTAVVPRVPSDHAVSVTFPRWPEGYIVAESSSTSPSIPASDGDVLRVPDGADALYTLRWRRRPEARVRVVDEAGVPVAGARVAVGIEHEGQTARLFDPAVTTDETGSATVALWTGSHLPDWTPKALVVAATAAGRGAAIVQRPGRWYGETEEIRLGPAPRGTFGVEGRLLFENGRPVQGVPVFLAATEPWNGHVAAAPLATTTDGDGAFRFDVPEALRALFVTVGGVRVAVDGERLEAMPSDAMWRSLWPSLARSSVAPTSVPLPAAGAAARLDGTVTLPP